MRGRFFVSVSVLALAFGALLVSVVILFWASNRGFDFSDEGYYLLAVIQGPSYSKTSVTDFTILLDPLYALLNGDIGSLRIAGMTILATASTLLAFAIGSFGGLSSRAIVLQSCALISASFWFYSTGFAVPGYNLINLAGLCIFLAGLFRATEPLRPAASHAERSDKIASVLLAASGLVLSGLVKPMSAVNEVLLGLLWIWLMPIKDRWAMLGLTALLTLALYLAIIGLFGGGVSQFVQTKMEAIRILTLLDQGGDPHGMLKAIYFPFLMAHTSLDRFLLHFAVYTAVIAMLWLVVIGMVRSSRLLSADRRRAASFAASAILAAIVGIIRARSCCTGASWAASNLMPMLVFGIAFLALRLFDASSLTTGQRSRIWRACLLVAIAPLVYSFGTNTALIYHMGGASIFFAAAMLLAILTVTQAERDFVFGSVCCFFCLAGTGLLVGLIARPGVLPLPLWVATEPVVMGLDRSTVLFDPGTAKFLRTLQGAAARNGFRPGQPIIDLSSRRPGLVFALNGVSPGAPWLLDLGDPRHDRRFTRALLSREPPGVVAKAWLLTGEPAASTDAMVAHSVGIAFPENFRKLTSATIPSPDDMIGAEALWKPR